MSVDVEIGNATVRVTPINELPMTWALTASAIMGRLLAAQEDGDVVAMKEALGDLIEICTEDGITSGGIQDLEPASLHALIDAMLPEEALEDDE